MAELKFITTADGAQCVMITGISMTLMWFAVSLVSAVRPRQNAARDMAKDLALSGWMTSSAMEQRLHCFTAYILAGEETTTVAIARMQAWSVTLKIMNCLCMGPCLIWIHRNSNVNHAYYVNADFKKSKKPLRVTRINLDEL